MRALRIAGWSIVCALLLTLFSQIQDMLKYIFSLGALYVGIQFFRRYETKGSRIAFVAAAILFFFVFSIAYAMYLFAKTGQVPNAGF